MLYARGESTDTSKCPLRLYKCVPGSFRKLCRKKYFSFETSCLNFFYMHKMVKQDIYLMKQWAAVSTQFLWIRVPPQVWEKAGSGRLDGQTWIKHADKQRRKSIKDISIIIIKYDKHNWLMSVYFSILEVSQWSNMKYKKHKGEWTKLRLDLFDISHLHGYLPGPGVWPGWLSVHNAWHNIRRNGWIPTCTRPV